LGLHKTLAAEGPLKSEELAERTGTTERNIRAWLAAQAASGYVEFDADKDRFSMTPEQIAVFADEDLVSRLRGSRHASIIAERELD
jgi:DNA-binding IclR family transcriptional regulator